MSEAQFQRVLSLFDGFCMHIRKGLNKGGEGRPARMQASRRGIVIGGPTRACFILALASLLPLPTSNSVELPVADATSMVACTIEVRAPHSQAVARPLLGSKEGIEMIFFEV